MNYVIRLLRLGAAFSLLATGALAVPVTGWSVVNPSTGAATTKPLSGALTDSPVLGNGSGDSAAMVALYADINGTLNGAPDVALANGERVTLTGSATLSGIISAMEQFRWGLFNESAGPFDASGWQGFIASNSAGSGGGALRAKPAESGTFAQTGSAVNLKTSQDGDDFIDETYHFSMTVSRFNNEVSIDASLTNAEDWTQIWKDVVTSNPNQVTFNFNRVGFLAGSGMQANRVSFSNIDVMAAPISALTLQVITTGPHAGAVQIRNDESTSFEIEYYEITSVGGSLNVGGWNSLDDQEGDDPKLENWEEAAGNDGKLLSEYRLSSTTVVSPSTSLTLGQAFDISGSQDLKLFVGLADGSFVRGIVEYVPGGLAGDYNGDGTVDASDYIIWRKNVGTNRSLTNDPTGGTIGPAQYDQWSINFGQSGGNGAAFGSSSNALVPEPDVVVILITGLLAVLLHRRAVVSLSQPYFGHAIKRSFENLGNLSEARVLNRLEAHL